MRIASKSALRNAVFYTATALIAACGSGSAGEVYAADAQAAVSPGAPAVMPSSAVPPPPAMQLPIAASPPSVAVIAPPTPALAANTAKAPMANGPVGQNMAAMENKVTDSANSILKRLDSSSDEMTLEDMNAARQTIARIETMIDVEKHLADLDKLRNDRNGASSRSSSQIAAAIPASALAPPMPMPMPSYSPPPMQMAREPMMPKEKPKSALADIEVSRIVGSEGKYSAVLIIEGDIKPVKIGDQISSDATVRWISPSSVLIEENGVTHTLRIKNVDAIFSAMR